MGEIRNDPFANELSSAELCQEYWMHEEAIEALKEKMELDLEPIKSAMKELEASIASIKAKYEPEIQELKDSQTFVKSLLEQRIPEGKNSLFVPNTHEGGSMHTNITRRTTFTTVILDKAKVVDVLIRNGKVKEGVNTFYKGFIKKLVEVGIMPKDAAKLEPKTSVIISSVE